MSLDPINVPTIKAIADRMRSEYPSYSEPPTERQIEKRIYSDNPTATPDQIAQLRDKVAATIQQEKESTLFLFAQEEQRILIREAQEKRGIFLTKEEQALSDLWAAGNLTL